MATPNRKLSSNLASMKFMTRVTESNKLKELQKLEEEKEAKSKWSLKVKGTVTKQESSFLGFMNVGTPRKSFGFNKEIEKLQDEMERDQRLSRAGNETKISDEEMASIAKKNQKRKQEEESPVFKKPKT